MLWKSSKLLDFLLVLPVCHLPVSHTDLSIYMVLQMRLLLLLFSLRSLLYPLLSDLLRRGPRFALHDLGRPIGKQHTLQSGLRKRQ